MIKPCIILNQGMKKGPNTWNIELLPGNVKFINLYSEYRSLINFLKRLKTGVSTQRKERILKKQHKYK